MHPWKRSGKPGLNQNTSMIGGHQNHGRQIHNPWNSIKAANGCIICRVRKEKNIIVVLIIIRSLRIKVLKDSMYFVMSREISIMNFQACIGKLILCQLEMLPKWK